MISPKQTKQTRPTRQSRQTRLTSGPSCRTPQRRSPCAWLPCASSRWLPWCGPASWPPAVPAAASTPRQPHWANKERSRARRQPVLPVSEPPPIALLTCPARTQRHAGCIAAAGLSLQQGRSSARSLAWREPRGPAIHQSLAVACCGPIGVAQQPSRARSPAGRMAHLAWGTSAAWPHGRRGHSLARGVVAGASRPPPARTDRRRPRAC